MALKKGELTELVEQLITDEKEVREFLKLHS